MAIAIVVFHVLVMALVALLAVGPGFNAQEVITTYAIITPFLGVYVTLAIDHAVENIQKTVDDSEELSVVFLVIGSLIPAALAVSVVAVIAVKDMGGILTAEQFSGVLGVIEAAFGVYAGRLLRALFPSKTQPKVQPAAGS